MKHDYAKKKLTSLINDIDSYTEQEFTTQMLRIISGAVSDPDYAKEVDNLVNQKKALKEEISRLKQEAEDIPRLQKIAEERATFITNGVEFGYITLPTMEIDPAIGVYERCMQTHPVAPLTAISSDIQTQKLVKTLKSWLEIYTNTVDDAVKRKPQATNARAISAPPINPITTFHCAKVKTEEVLRDITLNPCEPFNTYDNISDAFIQHATNYAEQLTTLIANEQSSINTTELLIQNMRAFIGGANTALNEASLPEIAAPLKHRLDWLIPLASQLIKYQEFILVNEGKRPALAAPDNA